MKSQKKISRLLMIACAAVFPAIPLCAAPLNDDALRQSEIQQQQLANQTQQLAKQLDEIIEQFKASDVVGEGIDVLTSMQKILSNLSQKDMQQVIRLMQDARGAGDSTDIRQAFINQKNIIVTLKQLLIEYQRQQALSELSKSFEQLAQKQNKNLKLAVELAQLTAGKPPTTPAQRDSLAVQHPTEDAIRAEVAGVLGKIETMAKESEKSDPDIAAKLKKAGEFAKKSELKGLLDSAVEDLKSASLMRAAGDEKSARDVLRDLARIVAPDLDPVAQMKLLDHKIERELAEQKAILDQMQKTETAKLDPQMEPTTAEHVDTTEQLHVDAEKVAPDVARDLKGAREDLQNMRAAINDKSKTEAIKNQKASIDKLDKADHKLKEKINNAEIASKPPASDTALADQIKVLKDDVSKVQADLDPGNEQFARRDDKPGDNADAKKPGDKPGDNADAKKPGDKPGDNADAKKPGDKPGDNADAKKPGDKPGDNADAKKPGDNADAKKPGDKPGDNADAKKPGDKPGDNADAKKPGDNADSKKPGDKPGDNADSKKPGDKPGDNADAKKPGDKPGDNADSKKPGDKPGDNADSKKPGDKPGDNADAKKPGDKPGDNADAKKPGDKPGDNADAKKPGDKPGDNADAKKPGDNADSKKPGDKPGDNADAKKPGDKPGDNADAKKPGDKPGDNADAKKPGDKPGDQAANKPGDKPGQDGQPSPNGKPDPNAAAQLKKAADKAQAMADANKGAPGSQALGDASKKLNDAADDANKGDKKGAEDKAAQAQADLNNAAAQASAQGQPQPGQADGQAQADPNANPPGDQNGPPSGDQKGSQQSNAKGSDQKGQPGDGKGGKSDPNSQPKGSGKADEQAAKGGGNERTGIESNVQNGGPRGDVTGAGTFLGLPQRDRQAVRQTRSERYPEEYGREIEQFMRNIADENR